MSLSKEAYKALEVIVGADNISDDPALLDAYGFIYPHTGETYLIKQIDKKQGHFSTRPDAVVLPGTTEEVQAVVKACNNYRIKYRAFATGWVWLATPMTEGVIMIDLRRMNRIIEIDVKNMYAVIEPYVIAAQLQAELMKVGLTCNLIGAGASCSPLAQSTSMSGHGPTSIYMGHGSEVLQALEWVMPDGEILRTGSLGSGCGWFCGEGPGPSLRGIARGKIGSTGGLGVFTKCAIKLSPWPGPAELPIQGTIPAYYSPVPENIRSYTVAFPDWQSYANSYYKIWDSEIGYIVHRQFNVFGADLQYAFMKMYVDPSKVLGDIEEIVKQPEAQKVTEEMRKSYQIVLVGHSQGDFEYQEKVLDKILADTGGWKVEAMSVPIMERWTYLFLIRLGHKNLNHVYTGGAGCSVTQMATPEVLVAQVPTQIETLAEYQEKGLLVKTGGDGMMGCVGPMGGGNYSLLEQFHYYDPHCYESIKASLDFKQEARERLKKKGYMTASLDDLIVLSVESREEADKKLSAAPNPIYPYIQSKIKQVLDPNDTGGISYIYLENWNCDQPGTF